MPKSIKKRKTLLGVLIGVGGTLALVIGLGVLAGAGAASGSAKPENTSPPTVSGTPQEGQTLSGDRGNWSNNPTGYNDYWTRCDQTGGNCSDIGGANNDTYSLTSSDVGHTLRFKVEAKNGDGTSDPESSAPTAVITAAAKPANTSPPTVSGTPQQGQTLSGDRGNWSGSPTDYNSFWVRCDQTGGSCSDIGGANNATYVLTSSDVGHTLRFKVEAKNTNGSTFASSVPTAVITASLALPHNTSPPTIRGTPREGQTLSGDRGTWSGNPSDFNDFWVRCDKNGGSCANISGANNKNGYLLKSVDVGNTIRFKVEAKNASGGNVASSVPTAVITAATKPPPPPPATAAGCPSGTGAINVASIGPPAHLLIDQQRTNPSVVHRGTNQLIVSYHVSACGGRSVQGALIYATAVPFNQLSIPPELQTNADGWLALNFNMLSGFPVGPRQQLLAIFVRARKSGESLLGGISTRRLFSVPVNLHG